MLKRLNYLISIFCFTAFTVSVGQTIDTSSVKINTRLSFYSFEKAGEIIIHIPSSLYFNNLNISIKSDDLEIGSWKGIPGKDLVRVPFQINQAASNYKVIARILTSGGKSFNASTDVIVLKPKQNEVKTDRLTGGLIVNRRIFFPFGFYCYSPVQKNLPEEEAVKGFNMISPYQKIIPETLKERKTYMDRCAQVGIKVHYNLLSVSSGGGVSSNIEGIDEIEKRKRLVSEIREFMDHPALLAWYISDEPNGRKIMPGQLTEIYETVKSIDPWHPVSIVFMAPFTAAERYSGALDIVMADPYPVPDNPLSLVGNAAFQLRKIFEGNKPVWIVPQAFGGGELWSREPTAQELRNMTYQAIVNGARGIQYFVRQGPNLFPKSVSAWSECGKISLEIAEITPWLLSDEKPAAVRSMSSNILTSSYMHDGQLVIIAVNNSNSPQRVVISISGYSGGVAKVLAENRYISVSGGILSDYISALGSQVYIIKTGKSTEQIKPFKDNLIKDPGFEDNSIQGVPASCYAWNEGDRGATYFTDTREHFEGSHSLRLVTPAKDKGIRLKFFPFRITRGSKYILSVWAKCDSTLICPGEKPGFEIGLGEYGKTVFYPGTEWKQFVTSVTIQADSIPSSKANLILRMPEKGTIWFDMIQVFEATEITRSINPTIKMDITDYKFRIK